jgi:hypothetical protein
MAKPCTASFEPSIGKIMENNPGLDAHNGRAKARLRPRLLPSLKLRQDTSSGPSLVFPIPVMACQSAATAAWVRLLPEPA